MGRLEEVSQGGQGREKRARKLAVSRSHRASWTMVGSWDFYSECGRRHRRVGAGEGCDAILNSALGGERLGQCGVGDHGA